MRIRARGIPAAMTTVVLAGVLLPATPAVAAVPYQDIATGGPLEHLYVGADLSCQVATTIDGAVFEFYHPSVAPGDSGTFLAVGGTLYTPDFNNHDITATFFTGPVPFAAVSQTGVLGTGTAEDPYRVVTVGEAGSLRITQTDSVVAAEEAFTTVVEVANTGGADVEAVLYRAGDCYISSSDRGFGSYDGASGAIGCVEEEAGAPGSRVAEFVPLSPGSAYFEGHYSDVWAQIDTRAPFPNSCLCDTALDNGAGLSWNLTVPAGGSVTRSHQVRWGSAGINQPPVPIMSGLPVDWQGPFSLTFEGGGSFDLDGQVVGYEWDFGDGGTSSDQTSTHAYLATGTFTVSLTVTDDDGDTATAFEDLAITGVTSVDFAPEVRLHPDEDHFPMNPVTFVDNANLQWAHDHGCDNDFVVENPIADLLGQANEYEHRVDRGEFPRCGRHSGRHYDSQDYTRPFDDGNPERENIAGEEGFYLDFDEGSEPGAFSPVPVWTERTTLADEDTALTYWFFYGRSVPRWNGIGLPFQHEGDWEHVNLIIDAATLVPGEAWFYAHHGEPDRQPFAGLTRTGFIHPVVYSARTAHGSYPTTGVTDVCNERGCIEDIRADGGAVWETWRDVRSTTDQGWYGFGGAWGAKGEAGDTTGPLGPSPYKNPV